MQKTTLSLQQNNQLTSSQHMQTIISISSNCSIGILYSLINRRILFLVTILLLIEKIKTATDYNYCEKFGPIDQCQLCQYQTTKYSQNRGGSYKTNVTKCSLNGQQISQSSCIDECCGFVYQEKSNTFERVCDGYKSFKLFLIIFLPTFLGGICLFLFTLFACFCICLYRISQSQQTNPEEGFPQTSENLIFQEIQQKQLPLDDHRLLNPNETCSICLQKSTEIMTNCQHFYHIDCFGKWLNKNNRCPLCNGLEDKFNPVFVFCRQCNYRVLGVKIDRSKGDIQTLMQKYKETVCQACKS